MHPVLSLHEDTLSNGTTLAHPALARMIFVVHGAATIAESGVPDYVVDSWYGAFAPAKTPPAIVAKLNAEFNKALALPDLRGRVPVHQGQGPGLSLHDLGETGGSQTVSLLESEIPSHSHNLMGNPTTATKSLATGTG